MLSLDFARRPFYLLFLGLFPVLSLLGINIAVTAPGDAVRAGVISIMVAGCALLAAYPVYRDWHRAALGAGILLVLFFSYGHVYNLLKPVSLRKTDPGNGIVYPVGDTFLIFDRPRLG